MTALQSELAKLESDRIAARIRLAGQQAHVATLEHFIDEAKVAKPPAGETDAKPAATGEERMGRLRGDSLTERSRLAAIEAELKELEETLVSMQKNMSPLIMILPKIAEKERARDIEEANYKLMSSKLETAAIDEALDGSRMPNISIVQDATPAVLDVNKRNKTALGIACGIPAAAIVSVLLFGLIFAKAPKRDTVVDKESPAAANS